MNGRIIRHPSGAVTQMVIRDGVAEEVLLVPPSNVLPPKPLKFKDPDELPPPPPPWVNWDYKSYFDAEELQLIDDLRFALQGDGTKAPIPWVIRVISEKRVKAAQAAAKQQPQPAAPAPQPAPSASVPDDVARWITERAIVGPEHSITSAAAYQDFCQFIGTNPVSQRKFVLALAGRGFARTMVEGKRGFAGLGLKG